jgi:geranylgeranyl diphosphate synthase type I
MSLEIFVNRYLLALREELRSIVRGFGPPPAGFADALHRYLDKGEFAFNYHPPWNSRVIQPVLCLLACEACDGDWEQALPAAAAIELMHDFILIHDAARRGNGIQRSGSTWTPWGQAQEINTGDALFALANLALGRLFEQGTSSATVLAVFCLFNRAELAFAIDQYLDISFEDCADILIEDYLVMAEGKAALTACACEIGALVASATDAQRESVRSFGYHLGLAQYVYDDVLRDRDEAIQTNVSRGSRQSSRREHIERLVRDHQSQAIAALEKGYLEGAPVQVLYELARTSFNDVRLFSLVRGAETEPVCGISNQWEKHAR